MVTGDRRVFVRYKVFMMVKIEFIVFWGVEPCSVVVGYRHFGAPCCIDLCCNFSTAQQPRKPGILEGSLVFRTGVVSLQT
jgi:hypothetical protein